MSYTALYRQWRPIDFDDVIGQNHIINTLKNGITSKRISHAYLFTGTHGTGKTTTAKILARAVNCESPREGNPCNDCCICKGILSGSLLDVIEIDAASNNGVDSVREIREEANYCPSRSKYKVYIIDEVHMLSSGAFNSLLKTLEEPPAHVIFILATTEPQKLPATILSRCQRYDFHKVAVQDIIKRIKQIANKINIQIDDDAIILIARISDGSLRDAISLFDQVSTLGCDNITYDDVLNIAGIVDDESISNIVDDIYNYRIEDIIKSVDEISSSGKSIPVLVQDIINYYRNLLVISVAGSDTELIVMDRKILSIMEEQVKLYNRDVLVKIIQELSSLLSEIKKTDCPKVLLEISLLRLCMIIRPDEQQKVDKNIIPQNVINHSGEGRKISAPKQTTNVREKKSKQHKDMEQEISTKDIEQKNKKQTAEGNEHDCQNQMPEGFRQNQQNEQSEMEQGNLAEYKVSADQSFEKWPEVLQALKTNRKSALYYNLEDVEARLVNDELLELIFKAADSTRKDIASQQINIQALQEAIFSVVGRNIQISYLLAKEDKSRSDGFMERAQQFTEKLGIPVNVIDE